jgi:SHS2 domain-containing protein
MNKLNTLLLLIFLFASCSADSDNDYVDIEIPPGLTNEKAIKSLKKDEKNLNRVFNSMEDGMIAFENMVAALAEIQPDTPRKEIERKIMKQYKKLAWSLTKAMYNGIYFVAREEMEKKSKKEILGILTDQEKIVFTKSLDHIKVKKEELEIKFEAYSNRLDSLMEIIESKEYMRENWIKNNPPRN